eukprot:scaffold72229_cov63-Phaeocystis_antarctica.AAC.1
MAAATAAVAMVAARAAARSRRHRRRRSRHRRSSCEARVGHGLGWRWVEGEGSGVGARVGTEVGSGVRWSEDPGRTVAPVPRVASAAPIAVGVGARAISMAVVRAEGALVNVSAVEAVASITTRGARARVASRSVGAGGQRRAVHGRSEVGAGCLGVAVVGVGGAFVDLVARIGSNHLGVAAAAAACASSEVRVGGCAPTTRAVGGTRTRALGARGVAQGARTAIDIGGGGASGHAGRGGTEVWLRCGAARTVVRCASVTRVAASMTRRARVANARVQAGGTCSEAGAARLVWGVNGGTGEAVGGPAA